MTESENTILPAPPVVDVEAKKLYLAALAKAQGAFPTIPRNRTVSIKSDKGNYTFKYAELAEILEKCRPALSANGLSLRSRLVPGQQAGVVWLQSILAHEGGYEDLSEISLDTVGDIKQFGGRLTYMRRYLGTLQLGIAADDDQDEDGEQGGDSSQFGQQQRAPAKAPPQRRPTSPPVQQRAPAPERSEADERERYQPDSDEIPAPARTGAYVDERKLAEAHDRTAAASPPAAAANGVKMANPAQVKWLQETLAAKGLEPARQQEILAEAGVVEGAVTAAAWTKAKQALLAL
jgi:hypothetical protein